MIEEVAHFLVETEYGDIPADAVHIAKNAIIDGLGVALAGTHEPAGLIVSEFAKEMREAGGATIIGQEFKTSALLAALANGTLMHALAFDDVATSWLGHPTAVILPATLAIGEIAKVSGEELLEAYLLGCEVAAKIGQIAAPRQHELSWHNTSTIGTMGAAAACAKILKLNPHETKMTLGIAASEAGGLKGNFGSMTKPLHAGLAARNGVMAAALAKRGFSANENVLENPLGFSFTFLGEHASPPSRSDLSLGNPFDLLSPGRTTKPYACCRDTHGCIDASLYLKKTYGISAEDVSSVKYQAGEAAGVAIHRPPRTGLEAKLSMQYCIAVALLFGEVRLAHFADAMIAEPELQSLMEKISGFECEGIDPLSASVTVTLKSGEEHGHTIRRPKGDPENPLSETELITKFKDCVSGVLSPQGIETSLDILLNLEKLNDVTELTHLLSFGSCP